MQLPRLRLIPALMVASTLAFFIWLSWPEQEGDPDFDARVAQPAYTDRHPHIYFDEGHWNVHTADGRYKPFANLARNDGYIVESKKGTLAREALAGYGALVIANALGFGGSMQQAANFLHLEAKVDFTGSAFSAAECAAVRDWVRDGGALLLIADHAPAGKAAAELAAAFGVDMTNGYAEEPKAHDPETKNWGFIFFSRENGNLLDHPITRGRIEAEQIHRVMSFTGQALRLKRDAPASAVSFLGLSPEARLYPRRNSGDKEFTVVPDGAQGIALEYGKGRVVVLGEAAMLTSQVARSGGHEFRFGLSRPGTDNRQLALNILHWLTRLL